MKTKYWIGLFAAILILCTALSIPLLGSGANAACAEIISDGQILQTVNLNTDQQICISSSNGGTNTVTVKDGRIAVTWASCPDHYCMKRGFCAGGTDIVCLPNRLVISFLGEQEVDAAIG